MGALEVLDLAQDAASHVPLCVLLKARQFEPGDGDVLHQVLGEVAVVPSQVQRTSGKFQEGGAKRCEDALCVANGNAL